MNPNSALEKFYLKHAREIVQRGTLSATLGSISVAALLLLINWHFDRLDSVLVVCGIMLFVGNAYRFGTYFDKISTDVDWFKKMKWTHMLVMFGFCGIFLNSYFEKSNYSVIIISYLVINALVSSAVFWQFLIKEDIIVSTIVYLLTAAVGFFIWSDDWIFQSYGSILIGIYFGFLLKQGYIKREAWLKQKKDEFELRNVVHELPSSLFQATGYNIENTGTDILDSVHVSISELQTAILKQLKNNIAENERKTAELARADKMASIGEMLSGIMHEINNPISIITSRIQLISNIFQSEKVDMEMIKKSFDIISRNAYRTSKIIAGVKTLFRETSIENFTDAELKELIFNTQEAVAEKIKKFNVELEFSFKNCDEGTKIFCFPLQISQVLVNLINNSNDAIRSDESKWIKVRFEMLASHFSIFVTDSGVGLSEEIQKKIELPFFTSKKAGEGSGIGLHISKKIIESHHGKFYYNTTASNTEFVIELPLQPAA